MWAIKYNEYSKCVYNDNKVIVSHDIFIVEVAFPNYLQRHYVRCALCLKRLPHVISNYNQLFWRTCRVSSSFMMYLKNCVQKSKREAKMNTHLEWKGHAIPKKKYSTFWWKASVFKRLSNLFVVLLDLPTTTLKRKHPASKHLWISSSSYWSQ